MKNYYDLLKDGTISLFGWAKFRWFECCIAIDFAYRHFPEAWLRDLAALLREEGADYREFTDTWKRPLNKWTFHTHIVNLAMMLKSEAVSADLLGEDYRDDAEALYRILKEYNGASVGTFTGDECLSGLPPIQGTELCSVVELMYSYKQLFAGTGDNKWAERLEDGFETVCAKVPVSRTAIGAVAEMTLIPYGCAKLHMTELPFAE